jgi:hypothetical protein
MDNAQQYKKLEKKLNSSKRRQLNNLGASEVRKIERLKSKSTLSLWKT